MVGGVVGFYFSKRLIDAENKKLNNTKEELMAKARKECEEIVKEAKLESKEIIFKGRQELDREVKEKKKELNPLI